VNLHFDVPPNTNLTAFRSRRARHRATRRWKQADPQPAELEILDSDQNAALSALMFCQRDLIPKNISELGMISRSAGHQWSIAIDFIADTQSAVGRYR